MHTRPLLPPLPLPEEMRAWDEGAVALGLSQDILMENAARAAFDVLRVHCPDLAGKRVWLFMGSGNNGGDAACLARHLLDAGAMPLVLHTRPLKSCKNACGRHVRISRAAGVAFQRCRPGQVPWAAAPDILVDGLLGTGFSGPLRPEMLDLVQQINALPGKRCVLALDIPSGLDGRTGLPGPEAVRATATVCFAAAKPGLALPHSRPWTGTVHVRPIGIPLAVQRPAPCSWRLLDGHCLKALASLPADSFKNAYGHVLVAGGAPGYGGAAHLAARAALRAGAGLVTATAPLEALPDIKNGWAEIMTLGLAEPPQHWPSSMPEALAELAARCTGLIMGPGMGRGDDAGRFLEALLDLPQRPPAVLDADALVLLAARPHLLKKITRQDILTPHPGEAGRLLGCSAADIQADRPLALERLCAICAGVVVLKGAGSLVGQADSPVLLCPYDVPQLAVGGSGDVLAGCIGGLRAAHAPWLEDGLRREPVGSSLLHAGLAVALHALTGLWVARQWPLRGNTPTAVADALPRTLAHYAAAIPEEDALPWPASQ